MAWTDIVINMSIEQASTPTVTDPKWALAAALLGEHFDAIRGSWNVDGRGQLQGWKNFRDKITAGVTDVEKLRDDLGVCSVGKGHWAEDCSEDWQCHCCDLDVCTLKRLHFHHPVSGEIVFVDDEDMTAPGQCFAHHRDRLPKANA